MDDQNPAKRSCHVPSSSIQNPNSLPIAPGFNQIHVDSIIFSFLSLPDSPSFSSPLSIGCSFDRVLDKFLFSTAIASADGSLQDRLINRTFDLASLLQESAKRCSRKLASVHNSNSWPLPPELTIKVFSMLDTKSLMRVAPSCTMFHKCAMDPLCYSHIDLTTAFEHADNAVVCSMIHRAGKQLRSLKLGSVVQCRSTTPLITRCCLAPLSFNNGVAGNFLRILHLYNLTWMDTKPLCDVLTAYSNITELKIVNIRSSYNDNLLEHISKSFVRNWRLMECMFLESYKTKITSDISIPEAEGFARDCPNLSSLTLIGFGLDDKIAQLFVKGFCKLKHLNLSKMPQLTGRFLRDLGDSHGDSLLETLILQDCKSLEESEVVHFLNSLLAGNFKFIRHIDISRNDSLASGGGKTYKPKFPLEKLKEERPALIFLAKFPSSCSSSSDEDYVAGYSSGSSYYSSEDESGSDSSSSDEDV